MSRLREWVTYDRWNAAIAAEFFTGMYGGRPVYLDLDDDALQRLGVAVEAGDEPGDDLVAAVRPTIRLHERGALFGAHVGRLRRWRSREASTPPPVIALLAFMSLVAERMRGDAEFRANNYYGRFIRICGADAGDRNLRAKVIRGFAEHSGELWTALNRW